MANRLLISQDSLEYVRVTVYSENEFGPTNPTSFPVFFAFRLKNTSTPLVFYAGQWTVGSGIYYAKILVGTGTGGLPITKGDYEVWLRIGAGTEIPVREVGTLIVK